VEVRTGTGDCEGWRKSKGGISIKKKGGAAKDSSDEISIRREEMNKPKTRCLSVALVIGVMAVFGSSVAFAQVHSTGLTVSKSCPTNPVAQGSTIQCSYTITNSGDDQHGVNLTAASETVPCPTPDILGNCGAGAGVPFDVLTMSATNTGCLQGGVIVTALGVSTNLATRSCTGSFDQIVPISCNAAEGTIIDKVEAAGTDADPGIFNGLPVGNFTTNVIHVLGQTCSEGEFCRTPGFWATHVGGGDDTCSQNITQAVIDEVGSLLICGETICSTVDDDASSAVEAMCVAVQGQQERQLARQLTAAALNCIVTNGDADCTGVSIDAVFDACNTICTNNLDADPTNDASLGDCVAKLDCFNNGGVFASGECSTGTCSNDPTQGCTQDDLTNCGAGAECNSLENNCHDAEFADFENVTLPNDLLPDTDPCFEKQGPADSTECKQSKKTDCTVIPPGEADCDTESCADPI